MIEEDFLCPGPVDTNFPCSECGELTTRRLYGDEAEALERKILAKEVFVICSRCLDASLRKAAPFPQRVVWWLEANLLWVFLLIAALLVIGSLASCKLPGQRDKYDRTPAGWNVRYRDQGTVATGLHSREEVYALFDSAMERSFPEAAALVGLDESYVRKTIRDRDALYTLHDDSMFEVDPGSKDAPQAVWASGLTWGRSFTEVAFYLWRSVDPADVPADAPAWTVHPNPNHPDKTIYGLEQDGLQFPALGYELHWQFVRD